jgi:protein-arginine kinase activator protein McsA
MGPNYICEVCGGTAVVHLAEILGGVKSSHHYCADHVPADLWPRGAFSSFACEVCGGPATIHIAKVLGGVQSEHHFCAEHAD